MRQLNRFSMLIHHHCCSPSTWTPLLYIHYKNKISSVKNKVCELHSGIHSSFYLNNDSILKQTLIINNLEVCTTVVPLALTNTLINEFHNCRGHQGCGRALNALKRRFWWKGMWRDIKYHISNCITCSKNLPNVSCHPQLHLKIPKVSFACIATDTIGKPPTRSSGNRYALTCIGLLTSYVIAVPMPDKIAESVVEAYLSGIKHIYSNPYRPQGNSWIKKCSQFPKKNTYEVSF